jgi:carboxyl-terminal processing protease
MGELGRGLNVVILDACRNNPFATARITAADGRVLKFRGRTPAGLSPVNAPQGTVIAFSTAPGGVAMDGPDAAHSLYTRHLLSNIGVPGLPLEQMFKRVRAAVTAETKRMQVPWESSNLTGEFCFRPLPDGRCGPADASLMDPVLAR